MIDRRLNERALATPGHFKAAEAELLMRRVAGARGRVMEIGSYFGRSTLFILAALGDGRRVVAVDSFVEMGLCRGHSAASLRATLDDPRATVIERPFVLAAPGLASELNGVTLIDADHSAMGSAVELALSVALSQPQGSILMHDHTHEFPGVTATAAAFVGARVLVAEEHVDGLAAFRVLARPAWLIEPQARAHAELPTGRSALGEVLATAISRLAG
jgi:hypothetical protein